MAMKKDGADIPNDEMAMSILSKKVFSYLAAAIPRKTPKIKDNKMETLANKSVAGKTENKISDTGWSLMYDFPK
jgi:hypothetical protein